MKRLIRLTESDLHRLIENSVKRLIKEYDEYGYNPEDYDAENEFNDTHDWGVDPDYDEYDPYEDDPDAYIDPDDGYEPNDNMLYNYGDW